MFAFLQRALEQPPETHCCCYTKGLPLLPPSHGLIYAIMQNSQIAPPQSLLEFFTMKNSFAATNLLCQKASFWHKLEHCVPEEIIQQLLKLSFTSVLYTVSHSLEKSANGSNKASRFIWWCPHRGSVVLIQPSSMVKSKPIYFARGAIL